MKILRKLIRIHKLLFFAASLFTILSVLLNLCWNRFLAHTIDIFQNVSSFGLQGMDRSLPDHLTIAAMIILVNTAAEYLSAYRAAYTCEVFAHEMRMGYSRYYLACDILVLSKLNVGEEQSAMQNELREISSYLNENLFSFIKQFVSFAVTVVFLFWQSRKLTVLTILPVLPLLAYCYFAGKVIKNDTQQCQQCREQINGLTGMLLELFPVIQIYDAYGLIRDTMNKRISEWQDSDIRKERVTARLMSLSGLLSFVPLLLLMGFGGFMVVNGEISIGIFYIFINLSGDVSGFLQNMPNIYAGFRRFDASVSRVEGKLWLNTQSV